MGATSAIGVYDDFTSSETGVPVRPSDYELAGRIDMKDEVAVE